VKRMRASALSAIQGTDTVASMVVGKKGACRNRTRITGEFIVAGRSARGRERAQNDVILPAVRGRGCGDTAAEGRSYCIARLI